MQIQWYPGHMYKAGKEIKKIIPNVDLIIEILDARIPFSSENPMLASMRGDKPCIKILNKNDLADQDLVVQWQRYLEQEKGVKTLTTSLDDPENILQLPSLCRKLVPSKGDRIHSLNCLIIGIPNVGKSTIINALAGKAIAKTGNEPAVTKRQQRINLKNGIVLFDTPGLLWPNLENKNSGFRLAITGAIKDTALEYIDIAYFAVNYLLQNHPESLKTRFSLDQLPETELEMLEIIGKKRGCLRAGGHVDMDKIAKIIINEFRSGLLGKTCLETPEMMEKELVELELVRERKAAKKAARKQKRKST